MKAKREPDPILRGRAAHRRTQADYLGAMLDAVTLDDWRDVVAATVTAAKNGDSTARTWLASYLVGRPATEAPSPLAVVAAKLSGDDALVNKLAKPAIDRMKYPTLYDNEDEAAIRAQVAGELAGRIAAASEPSERTDTDDGGRRLRAVGDGQP